VWTNGRSGSTFGLGPLNYMDRQRLLIVGAKGFLGTHAVKSATDAFEVIRGDRSGTGQPESVEMDIADTSSVDRAFHQARPDFVLLLAAMSDIDRCERLPEQAFAVNAHGAENVANACARTGARLLFTSSAAVFDGRKHGYREEDAASPLSVYGKTKAWAESAVKALAPSAIVIRFALVLGFARRSGTNAMLDNVIERWKAGEPVSFSTREVRNPIDAASLSKTMIGMLADHQISGVYHVGASDGISRYELGKRLAARAGVSADLVRPQDDPVPGRAPRGENHFLRTEKIRTLYSMEVPSSDQVVERCFS
jgi:dTDP-4-dehydrorhamnose reductase